MTHTPAPIKTVNKGKLIAAILVGLPYSDQIRDIDLDNEPDAIRFIWRGTGLHVGEYGGMPRVSEIQPNVLVGSNFAILAEKCISFGWLINEGILK